MVTVSKKKRYLHCNEVLPIDKIEHLIPSDKWANPKKVTLLDVGAAESPQDMVFHVI